ncbi:MAG: hypothetical protein NTV81_03330 [Candidatus Komeilibacteria bacterium]|nr:hypothetical protein [Candidatus Komeilibacteria bacterium]
MIKKYRWLNYLGQIRIYSFLDLLFFVFAITRDGRFVIGIGLLWLGFLAYLESRHHDKLRLAVSNYLWIFFLLGAIAAKIPIWLCLVFSVCSYFYAKKKQGVFWGATSPFWRAGQNSLIALAYAPALVLVVFVITGLRNLIGDWRDVYFDKKEGLKTIPVLLGVTKNQPWAYYAHLGLVCLTTGFWFYYAQLDPRWLILVVIVQIASYPLTPRLSNPKYLDIYS